jgi:hypothetical protein
METSAQERSNMSFLLQTNTLRRTLVLALFLVSMLGPWVFDTIHVPAQYACGKPFIRLSGDLCGYPLSGLETIKWFGGGVSYIFGELIQGNLAAQIPSLLMLMGILLILLPFFSLLLVIGNQHSRRLHTFNIVIWGLACLLTSAMFLLQTERDQFVQFVYWLWGLGLYSLLAIGTILDEILMGRLNSKHISGSP